MTVVYHFFRYAIMFVTYTLEYSFLVYMKHIRGLELSQLEGLNTQYDV